MSICSLGTLVRNEFLARLYKSTETFCYLFDMGVGISVGIIL